MGRAPVTSKREEKQRIVDQTRRQIEQLPVGEYRRAGMMSRLASLAEKHGVKATRR
jgi:hypothetical protein